MGRLFLSPSQELRSGQRLVRLLGSARHLRVRLASMDHCACAPSPAVQPAVGLRSRVHDLTGDVQVLRRQVSAERREGAAWQYLNVTEDAPTEEQLDRLLVHADNSDAALLSSPATVVEEQQEAAREVAEVERGLLELQQICGGRTL